MDIATSKTGSSRKEFNRLLEDCNLRKIEIVITKNISRFGRNTVEILDALNQLKALGISEGKMIGAILNALLAQVLNNPELNEYEKLEELALKIYQEVQ